MVFGLSIGNKRRSSRVPDLSRYDYHYNGDGPSAGYYKSHDLSADAAFAASVNSGGRSRSMVNTSLRPGQGAGAVAGAGHGPGHGPGHGGPGFGRGPGQGMAHGTSFAPRKAAGNSRVSSRGQRQSSGPVPYGYGSSPGYGSSQVGRSYSLTSGPHVSGARQGKKQGKVGSKASSRAGSLTNSIIIKRQEVKDMSGRTQSITTQTIRRVNGMEYVETTTQTTGALADDPQFHFQQFSENNGLSEEEMGLDEGLEEGSVGGSDSRPEPEVESEPESEPQTHSRAEPEPEPEPRPVAKPVANPEPEPEHEHEHEYAQEDGSEGEPEAEDTEFADASEIVEEEDHNQFFAKVDKVKVDTSGHHAPAVHEKKAQRKSAMSKRMTLRGSEGTEAATESPVAHTYQGKRRVQAPPVVAPSSSRKVLTQEEMYAMALEIAQQRYAESQLQKSSQAHNQTIPVQSEIPSQSIKSAGSHSGMEPILEDTAENPVEGAAAGPTGVPTGVPTEVPTGPSPPYNISSPVASGPVPVTVPVPVSVPTNEKSKRPKKKVKSLFDRVVQFSQENTLSQPSGKHRRGQVQAQPQAQPQVQPQPEAPAQAPAEVPAQAPAEAHVETLPQPVPEQTLSAATMQETSSSSSLRHAEPQQEEEPVPQPQPVQQPLEHPVTESAPAPAPDAQSNHVTRAAQPSVKPQGKPEGKGSPKKKSFFKKLFKTKDKHH